GDARCRGIAGRQHRALSARVLRRAAAAHRDRAGAGAPAVADRLRRTGLGARRLDPGPGAQPARGPATVLWPHVPLHLARPLRRALRVGPRDGDERGTHRRDRALRRDMEQSKGPLYPQPDRRRPRRRVAGAGRGSAMGDGAVSAVPKQAFETLPGGRADARRAGLDALEARLREDLERLCLPAPDWLARPADDEALDVAIVGGGMSGLAAAAALWLLGVHRIRVFDRSPAGEAGPWVTHARMETLRSPKHLTGPALGLPSLTFRAWY